MKGNLIIISSPSGGGKGTLIKGILHNVPNIGYSVSYTTRNIRVNEENGKDYFFVSKETFKNLIETDEFLEYAEVHGNFYGTSINQIEKEFSSGRDIILEIDVQGAELVIAKMPEAVSIFIFPPSFQSLCERLTKRATESQYDLDVRLKNSIEEVSRYKEFQYVVINDEIEDASRKLENIILAERQKRTRQIAAIKGILDSFDVK
jgi:guanylate kinase